MIIRVTSENKVTSENQTMSDAARLYGQSLPPAKHADSQEALRFARWFGEDRQATEVRPSDLEAYIESFGSNPTASARADALKGFLAYAHKQKILPERLVSHVRVRRSSSRSKGAVQTLASTQVQLTAEGKAALEKELEDLKAQRPRIAAELQAARADGDVRENAPLDAAREAQGQIEARIRELEPTLRHAVVADSSESGAARDRAHIGATVVIANLQTGAKLSYQLVNSAEARPGTGRLSVESPVGQAVVGKRVGDEVLVTAPSGLVRFKIESIEA
jgi:transcription elongation factor GreA